MRRFRSFARSVGVDPRDFAALSPFGGCDPGDLSRYAADMAELHFCTVCGVSVPQAEVDSGNAVVQGERSVCPDCMGLLGVASVEELKEIAAHPPDLSRLAQPFHNKQTNKHTRIGYISH